MPAPSPVADAPDDDPWAADLHHYRAILHELADLGMDLARAVHADATAAQDAKPTPAHTADFDRIARTVRRTVALAHRIGAPRAPGTPVPDRTRVRERIIRDVEDAIGRTTDPGPAAVLRAELAERLDDPALDDDILSRPVAELIEEIRHDLGIGTEGVGARRYWQRRTPHDVAALRARAAQSAGPRPVTAGLANPSPPAPAPALLWRSPAQPGPPRPALPGPAPTSPPSHPPPAAAGPRSPSPPG